MKKTTVFKHTASLSNNDALLITLFIAAIAHIILIVSIGFSIPKPEKISRAIDITLVNTPTKKPPKDARFLAQDNQEGSGEHVQKPKPPAQKLPDMGDNATKSVKETHQEESKPKPAPKTVKVITQQKAEKTATVTSKKPEESEHTDVERKAQITMASLRQQIQDLGEEIRVREQQSADKTKMKPVNQVSAHKYVAAQYMKDWEARVERVGNSNYPKEAIQKGYSATLTMDVGIKKDGTIYSIKITRSSGNPALDEAARRIVRMSAPFAPLPAELLKELDVLVIPRVWKFSDESGTVVR